MAGREKILGIMGLLIASFFWGAEFVVEKNVLGMVDANYSNAIRFAIASIICTILFLPQLKKLKSQDIKYGLITGLFMGLGFAFQTMGLKTINAAENAVLCSAYILMLPFIEWLYLRKNPGLRVFIYAGIAIIGIYLISYDGPINAWKFSQGEILTLLGSIFYAIAIFTVNCFSEKTDPRILTLIQFYVIALLAVVFAIALEKPPTHVSLLLVEEFVYLILFATIGAQMLMNCCMKYVTSSAAGIIFSTESIFTALLGMIFLGESGNALLWIGMGLIIGTNMLYQVGMAKRLNLLIKNGESAITIRKKEKKL